MPVVCLWCACVPVCLCDTRGVRPSWTGCSLRRWRTGVWTDLSDLSSDEEEEGERRDGATMAETIEARRSRIIKSMLAEDVEEDEEAE